MVSNPFLVTSPTTLVARWAEPCVTWGETYPAAWSDPSPRLVGMGLLAPVGRLHRLSPDALAPMAPLAHGVRGAAARAGAGTARCSRRHRDRQRNAADRGCDD